MAAKKSKNKSLHSAKKKKEDEFYTRLCDIDNELKNYKKAFHGKIVFCNCDDPYESNFFKYFALNFNKLGLKKLICTCYDSSPVAGGEVDLFTALEAPTDKKAYKVEITSVEDYNGDGAVDLNDVEILVHKPGVVSLLNGNGDFKSDECIELLKESDIVVTNPPFSLFRDYISLLKKYEKQFLIIGNKNAISYKEVFPLFRENKIWIGTTPMGTDLLFDLPEELAKRLLREGKAGSSYKIIDGIVYGRATAVWFTNIDHKKRHEALVLYKHYSEEEYPKYDNYEAINVDKVKEIPMDYEGVIGVPITFLDKYCPEQFTIIGMCSSAGYNSEIVGIPRLSEGDARPLINNKNTYARIFIKRKTSEEG